MKFVTVRFDRVFDLHRRVGGRYPTHTQFSFESDGHIRYSVSVPGLPEIEAGMTVTVVLAEPGNWQSLKGWRNWSNGEYALPETRRSLIFAFCCLYVAFLFAPTQQSNYFYFSATFSVFMTFIAVGLIVQWWRQRGVVRVLKDLNEHPPVNVG
jgi:hypothetical protein